MFINKHFSSRLIAGFLLVFVVPLFLSTLISYLMAKQRLEALVVNTQSRLADIEEGHALEFLDSLKKRVVDFSSDGFIRDSVRDIQLTGSDPAPLNTHLAQNKQSLDPTIFGINVVGLNGTVISSTASEEIGIDQSGDQGVITSLAADYGQAYMSEVEYSQHFGTSDPVLTVSAPLTDKTSGERFGVITNYIKLGDLNKVLSGQRQVELGAKTGSTGRSPSLEIYLVNREGLMITQSNFWPNVILKTKVESEPVKRCRVGTEMTGLYQGYRGIPVVGASMCLPNGWTLLVETDSNEAFIPLAALRTSSLYIGVFLLAALVFLVIFVTRIIVHPIQELSKAAQTISGGNLKLPITVRSRDEVGQLATAFEQMRLKLQSVYSQLEEKVNERTRELVKFQKAVSGATDGVVITNTDRKIVYVNRAWEQLTGYTQREALGKNLDVLRRGKTPQQVNQQMWKQLRANKPFTSEEIINRRKNGQEYQARLVVYPIQHFGRNSFYVGLEQDISERKSVDRAKSEFVSLASHQLRTPLSAVSWYAEMLLAGDAGKLSKKQEQYLEEVYRGNKRMITLVNALLNVSRIELGTLAVNPKPTGLRQLIDGCLEELEQLRLQKRVTVTRKYDSKLPPINLDPELMGIAIANSLHNAIKYNREDGTVTVEATRRGERVLITIADTGCGIPAHQQKRVFTKLFRADNVVETESDGTGLGLYIARAVVEAADGKMWFTSRENKGTTFYIELPLSGMTKRGGSKGLL